MKILTWLLLLATAAFAQTSKEYTVVFKPGTQDEFLSLTTPEGKVFKNVRVVAATVEKLKIVHEDGAASLPMKEMPGEVKARFNYDKLKSLDVVLSPVNTVAPLPPIGLTAAAGQGASAEDIERRPVPADMQAAIRAFAVERFPNSYDMQQWTIEKQTKAANQFAKILEKGIERMPNDVLNAIWNRAWNKWGVNFDMCVYEVEKESAAWKKLNP